MLKTRKNKLCLMVICLAMLFLTACGSKNHGYNPLEGVETITVTDDCGRNVTVPKDITRIAASGSSAQMVLMAIAADELVGLTTSPSTSQMPYFPEEMWYLPTFGQFYGSKSNLNMEALIDARPQLILDIGDKKDSVVSDMNSIQNQTGIPTMYLSGDLDKLAATYRLLGSLLGKEEQGEVLAQYVEKTISMAEQVRERLSEEPIRVYYGTGASSLACNASGSSQASVIDTVGAVNAVIVPENEVTNKGGGTLMNLEELFTLDPDVIVLEAGGQYEKVSENEWAELTAVKEGRVYEIPNSPYSWMSSPPSVNRLLGVWWLGNLLYPDYYDYDMVEVSQEFYQLFWHYELSEDEAKDMMLRSTYK